MLRLSSSATRRRFASTFRSTGGGRASRLRKTASVVVASPGDGIQYSVRVTNADAARATADYRYRHPAAADAACTQHGSLQWRFYKLSGKSRRGDADRRPARSGEGASGTLTYLLEVRPDAQAGNSMNRARAVDSRGAISPIADAMVRIARDGIGDRLTIIGRVTDGGCGVDPNAANGLPRVRVHAGRRQLCRHRYRWPLSFRRRPARHPCRSGRPLDVRPQSRPGRMRGQCAKCGQCDLALRHRSGRHPSARRLPRALGRQHRPSRWQAPPRAPGLSAMPWPPVPIATGWTGQTPGIDWLFPTPDHNPAHQGGPGRDQASARPDRRAVGGRPTRQSAQLRWRPQIGRCAGRRQPVARDRHRRSRLRSYRPT